MALSNKERFLNGEPFVVLGDFPQWEYKYKYKATGQGEEIVLHRQIRGITIEKLPVRVMGDGGFCIDMQVCGRSVSIGVFFDEITFITYGN